MNKGLVLVFAVVMMLGCAIESTDTEPDVAQSTEALKTRGYCQLTGGVKTGTCVSSSCSQGASSQCGAGAPGIRPTQWMCGGSFDMESTCQF